MNKKLVGLYLCLCFMLISYFLLPNKTPVFQVLASGVDNAEYIFYAKNIEKLSSENVSITKNGNIYIVKTTFKTAKNIKPQLSEILGEAIVFNGNMSDIYKLLYKNRIEVKLNEKIDDISTIYAYKTGLSNYIFVDNEKVNLEIAFCKKTITIGYPIILGDY